MTAAACRLRIPAALRISSQRLWSREMGLAAQASMEFEGWRPAERGVEEMHRQEQDRGVQWVFLGSPGVGKGTYASRLAKFMQVPHIAMGDLVRHELLQKSPMATELAHIMSSGQLLPDDVIFRLLSKRLESGVSKGESGFILDGFPRTVNQAEILEDIAEMDLVVNLKLREDALIAKCLGRRICSQCGGIFNVARIDFEKSPGSPPIFMPPLLPPPSCASKMTIRPDDTEEVVRARLRVYNEESKPVEDFYRSRGLLMEFDVGGGIPETWPRLLTALNLEEKDTTTHDSRKMAA